MNSAHPTMRPSPLFPFGRCPWLEGMTEVEEVTGPAVPDEDLGIRGWLGVAAVTAATFTVVSAEMLPVGLLTPMSKTLQVSTGAVGVSLTVTGLVAAVSAPVLTAAFGRFDRRVVMSAFLAVLVAGNLGAALAPSFAVLIGSRVLVGVAMGGVWAIAASIAARLVPSRSAGTATSLVFSGVAIASVLGVPLGTYLGALAGWQAAFMAVAVLALLVLCALMLLLPALPSRGVVALGAVLRLTGEPRVRTGLLVVAFLVTGHFAAYTYIRPALEQLAGMDATTIATMLLIYGGAGVLGNFAAGAMVARSPHRTLAVISATLAATVLLVPVLGVTWPLVVGLLVVWGLAYGGVSVSSQTWIFAAAPQAREGASSMFAAVFNAAIALGAVFGGVTADGFGVGFALVLGGVLAVAAMFTVLVGSAANSLEPIGASGKVAPPPK